MRTTTIHAFDRVRAYEHQGYWPGRTLFDAFEDVLARTPDKLLVVAGGVRWTYRQVSEKVELLACNLAKMGLGHGDIISMQLPNWAEFLVIHLAATRLGAVTNPLLPIYRAKELRYILSFAHTKMAFIPRRFRTFDYTALYREMATELPDLRHICVVGGDCPDDMLDFAALLRGSDADSLARGRFDGNDATVLVFTSGTESSPKGVLHSHNTLMFGNVTMPSLLQLTPNEVIWAVSPISHATGLEWGVRQTIVLGCTIVLQDVWEVEAALELIERERCTFTTAATSFAAMLLESPSIERRDLSSFKTFLCGGAAIPAGLGAAMLARMGCNLIPCWGMSECFAATMARVDDPQQRRWGADGRTMPGSETAIFDNARVRQHPAGEIGEIATRGPHVCLGYFNDSERTTETFSDGWLFSNDLGFIDEAGYLHVVGRKKDIINRGGLKISAREVEELLMRHPTVHAVALVGLPDARLGERSCACVVPVAGAVITLADLVASLRSAGVADYKLPEYLALVDELPMTPTGKIQKFKLRDDLVGGTLPMTAA
jgi:non-ribosomal peptide synthetase component E (peptide arylation enzyme)